MAKRKTAPAPERFESKDYVIVRRLRDGTIERTVVGDPPTELSEDQFEALFDLHIKRIDAREAAAKRAAEQLDLCDDRPLSDAE
jgi:hypothetical protein